MWRDPDHAVLVHMCLYVFMYACTYVFMNVFMYADEYINMLCWMMIKFVKASPATFIYRWEIINNNWKKSVSFFVTLSPHFGNSSIYTMEVNVTKNDTLKISVSNAFRCSKFSKIYSFWPSLKKRMLINI